MFTTILRHFQTTLSPSRRPRKNTSPATARRLQVEALEERCVLSYAVTDLGTLPGYETSYARDINAAGQVVGRADSNTSYTNRAFLWGPGTGMLDLGTLGGANSWATAINDAGQVVGAADTGARDADGYPIADPFVWQDGVMTDMSTLGGRWSFASDINASGQVVGVGGADEHAFLWENGIVTDLGTLPGYTYRSRAEGINDFGQVVGFSQRTELTEYCYWDWNAGWVCRFFPTYYERAFLWQGGVMTDLGTIGNLSHATAINASGQIVGYVGVQGISVR
jgi:probable HAF family extracellular repeat protein